MQKFTRILLMALLAIPILMLSTVYANPPGGPGYRAFSNTPGHPAFVEPPFTRDFSNRERARGGRGNPFDGGDHGRGDGRGGDRPSEPHMPGDPGDPRAPLDGGLSLLLAAGIGLGVKKAFGKKNAVQPVEEADITEE
jgi:hypothetical protein